MILVNFRAADGVKLGVCKNDTIVDVNAAATFAGLSAPGSLDEALRSPGGLGEVRAVLSAVEGKNGPWKLAKSSLKLAAPVPQRAKILGIALNYHDACKRAGVPIPAAPRVFSKLPTTLVGPQDSIELPAGRKVTWEGELAVVIGRRAKNVAVADAWDYIAGYSVLNDLTANDAAKEDVQLMRSKNFDTFCPMGPALVTRDEIADPYRLQIKTTVNGVVRQDSTVAQMIFRIPEILCYFASFLTLEPGDVLATGTPAGTALQFDPPAFLAVGDLVTVNIEGIGTIANRIVAAPQAAARKATNPGIG
jgi:2-keto-4-pentenoate hydratase/2-oxohepta-3-ene-1,7-dioic acid hydratase in catechol pathway